MTIPKRNGERRILHNPDARLRDSQYRILTRVFNYLEIPSYIHAFEKRKSIPSMAALHTNKRLVLSIDLKDFFHSITQARIYETLLSLSIGESAAKTLSELCTYKFFMPQGALTSPKLANIITATSFGPLVKRYCDEKGLTLSIYADDITMSTNDEEADPTVILREVMELVKGTGFKINFKKTKVMYKSNRQYVCGVVVNAKTNLIKKDRYKLRAIVHNVICNGVEAEAEKSGKTPSQFISHLMGRLNWFKQLNPVLGGKLSLKLSAYLKNLPVMEIAENILAEFERDISSSGGPIEELVSSETEDSPEGKEENIEEVPWN